MERPITLKEAREQGKIDEFIRQHEDDKPGDLDKLERAIKKAVKTSTTGRKTSRKGSSDC